MSLFQYPAVFATISQDWLKVAWLKVSPSVPAVESRVNQMEHTWHDPHQWFDPVDPSMQPAFSSGALPSELAPDNEPFSFDLYNDQSSYWRVGEWEKDDIWVGDDDVESDVDPEYASKMLADLYLDKYHTGNMYATDICQMSWWAMNGGMTGAVTKLAKQPGLHTSR